MLISTNYSTLVSAAECRLTSFSHYVYRLVCDESYKIGGINEISCNEEGENPSVRSWSENQALCILV